MAFTALSTDIERYGVEVVEAERRGFRVRSKGSDVGFHSETRNEALAFAYGVCYGIEQESRDRQV